MPWQPPQVAYLPLDGRPPNLFHVRRLSEIAGIELLTPSRGALGTADRPARMLEIETWLDEVAGEASHLLVSLDALCYGGLVQSRRARPRLAAGEAADLLKQYKLNTPDSEILLHAVLPRGLPQRSSTVDSERLEHLLDRLGTRSLSPLGTGNLPEGLSHGQRRYLQRRFRYLSYLSELLDQTAKFARDAVIGADDVISSAWLRHEREWLRQNTSADTEKLTFLDGADELGQTLLAKVLSPTLQDTDLPLDVLYPEGLSLRGRFESRGLARSLYDRCNFLGLEASHFRRLSQVGEIFFVLNWHQGEQPDHLEPAEGEDKRVQLLLREQLRKRLSTTLDDIKLAPALQICDLSWANGGSPEWWGAFAEEERLSFPRGYSGFNTQANALGSALATWVATHYPGADDTEQMRYAIERMLDDFYYQVRFREEVRGRLAADDRDPDGVHPNWDGWGDLASDFEAKCERFLDRLEGMDKLPVERDSLEVRVEFPWNRAFEAEVRLI